MPVTSVRGRLNDEQSVYYQLSLCVQDGGGELSMVRLSAPKWQMLYEESYRLRGSRVTGLGTSSAAVVFPAGGRMMGAIVDPAMGFDEFLIT